MSSFVLFLPETLLLLGALGSLVFSLADRSERAAWVWALAWGTGSLGAAAAGLGADGEPFFPGIYRVDLFSQLVKTGLAFGYVVALALNRDSSGIRPLVRLDVPFYLALSTVGMMMLVSATELVTFYVALELSAAGLYIAVAVHRDVEAGGEAAAKYVLFGVVTSAVTLYGMSLVFGVTGSTYFADIAARMGEGAATARGGALLDVGLFLLFASLLFKLALFPFHFWAPDVYQRAPQAVAAFLATASKLAAIGALVRLSAMAAPQPGALDRTLWALAVAAMTVGNLAAIAQKDFRRLLGYSAAAHAGYLMVGLGGFSENGLTSGLFYGVIYLLMSALAFVVVCVVDREGNRSSIEDLNGLWRRSPSLALLLIVAIFGLAGIPPTAGFAGKWFVFSAALERGQFVLVLIAAVNSTVALYYYLLIVKAAYLAPADGLPVPRIGRAAGVTGAVVAALTLVAGVWPGPLWEGARVAARELLGG